MRLWDYCAECREKIHNVTPLNLFQLNGNAPTFATRSAQGDISNICIFGWYDWCYFLEEGKVKFSFPKKNLVVFLDRWRMREMKWHKLSSRLMDASFPVGQSGTLLLRRFTPIHRMQYVNSLMIPLRRSVVIQFLFSWSWIHKLVRSLWWGWRSSWDPRWRSSIFNW